MIDKQKLEELYLDKKLSSFRIGKLLGVSKTTILRWLRDYNIPMRRGKEALKYRPMRSDVKKKVWHVSGYWRVWNRANKAYQWLHRKIWEDHNGPIPEGGIIHHVNNVHTDNRIENLKLWTQAEHIKHHKNVGDMI